MHTQRTCVLELSEQSKETGVCNIVAVLQSLPNNCNAAKLAHTIAYGLSTLRACMHANRHCCDTPSQAKSSQSSQVKQTNPGKAKPSQATPNKAKPSKQASTSKQASKHKQASNQATKQSSQAALHVFASSLPMLSRKNSVFSTRRNAL
jgi:hypothetical protein